MIIKVILCIIIPMLFLSIILEKRPRNIVICFCLGVLACFLAYFINSALLEALDCGEFYLSTTIAPIVEELLKFIPILLISLFLSKRKEALLPLSFAIGIGFAVTENFYMLTANTTSVGWIILKGIGSGLMHAMSASIIGLGIAKAREFKEVTYVGIVASLFLAMIYHGIYNCLVYKPSNLMIIGFCIPLLTYTVIFILYRKDAFKDIFFTNKTNQ